jgi:hypothetical protein
MGKPVRVLISIFVLKLIVLRTFNREYELGWECSRQMRAEKGLHTTFCIESLKAWEDLEDMAETGVRSR